MDRVRQGWQILPAVLNQSQLLCPRPALDLLLARERVVNAIEPLGIRQVHGPPLAREVRTEFKIVVVLPYAGLDIVERSAAGIERSVCALENVRPSHRPSLSGNGPPWRGCGQLAVSTVSLRQAQGPSSDWPYGLAARLGADRLRCA